MLIVGLNKTTLLDYPQKVAATIFTGGCNFRCPFCHNSQLVLAPNSMEVIPEAEVFEHLKRRQGVLDGVCITGGEPTLQKDLADFIRRIKNMGYLVKLDTNGSNPKLLKLLIDEKLLDYVAMDVKAPLDSRYINVSKCNPNDVSAVKDSLDMLKKSDLDYEVRTTVVRELHPAKDIVDIAESLKGCPQWFLQGYVDSENVIAPIYSAYTKEELARIIDEVEAITGVRAKIRGMA